MAGCSTPNQCRWGHLPNCPASRDAETGDIKPTKREMSQSWYPTKDGKPVPGNKLTEYEKALVISNGDTSNIVVKGGHAYAKKDKRKK